MLNNHLVHLMSSIKHVKLKALSKCVNIACRLMVDEITLSGATTPKFFKFFEDYTLESGQSNYYVRNSLSILFWRDWVCFLHAQGM